MCMLAPNFPILIDKNYGPTCIIYFGWGIN